MNRASCANQCLYGWLFFHICCNQLAGTYRTPPRPKVNIRWIFDCHATLFIKKTGAVVTEKIMRALLHEWQDPGQALQSDVVDFFYDIL